MFTDTESFSDDFEFDLDFSSSEESVDSSSSLIVDEYLTNKRLNQFTQDVFLPMPLGEAKALAIARIKDLIQILQDNADIDELIDGVTSDAEFKWCLFIIVKLSSVIYKDFPEIALVASSAITILNYARESFSGMNLKSIRIPEADLTNAMLDSADVSEGVYQKTNAPGIWLRNADARNSNLKDALFGEHAALTDGGKFLASCAAFGASRRHMVSAEGGSVSIWDLKTLTNITVLQAHASRVLSLVFSQDNKLLVSGDESGEIFLWRIENRISLVESIEFKKQSQLSIGNSKKNRTLTITISYDNRWMAAGCEDENVYLWRLEENSEPQLRHILTGHSGAINMVAFSADDEWLVSASEDYTTRLWRVTDENIQSSFLMLCGHKIPPKSDSFIPDKKTGVVSIAFNSDKNKQLIATGGEDKQIRIWNSENFSKCEQILTGHEDAVLSLAFSADNQTLISSGADKAVYIWSRKENGEFLKHAVITGHEDRVINVAFDYQEQLILSVSHHRVLFSDAPNYSLTTEEAGHKKDITCLVAHEKGWIVSGDEANKVYVWRMLSGKKLCLREVLKGYSEKICAVALSDDAQYLAATDKKNIQLYRIQGEKIISERTIAQEKTSRLSFHPNNSWLITATRNHVQLWSILSGQMFFSHMVLDGNFRFISTLSCSINGDFIAVGSVLSDQSVRLWKIDGSVKTESA